MGFSKLKKRWLKPLQKMKAFRNCVVYCEALDALHFVVKLDFCTETEKTLVERLLSPLEKTEKKKETDGLLVTRFIFSNSDRYKVHTILFGRPGTPSLDNSDDESTTSSSSSSDNSSGECHKNPVSPSFTRPLVAS